MRLVLAVLTLLISLPSRAWLEAPQVDAMAWRSLLTGGRYFISKHIRKNEPVYVLTTIGPDGSLPYRVISSSMYKTYTQEILNLTKSYRYPDPKIYACENYFVIEVKAPKAKSKSRAFCMAGFNQATSKKIVAWERSLDQWFR